MKEMRLLLPVLYIDLDDSLVSRDAEIPQVDGVQALMQFALQHFEVRWLTGWTRTGGMPEEYLPRLERALGIPQDRLRNICGGDWSEGNKLNGIAWLEHISGRPFFLIDDSLLPSEVETLERMGFRDSYLQADTRRTPDALLHILAFLRNWIINQSL